MKNRLILICITLVIFSCYGCTLGAELYYPIKAKIVKSTTGSNFIINTTNGTYSINNNGEVKYNNKSGDKESFKLHNYGEPFYVDGLCYYIYKGDLILIYYLEGAESEEARLTRLKAGTILKAWDLRVSSVLYNVIENNNIYLANNDYLAAVNLDFGKVSWEYSDLEDKYSIDKFKQFNIKHNYIELIFLKKYDNSKEIKLKFNKITGKQM